MTIATAPKLETTHPPLARDAAGNLLSIPHGTAAFAAARETTGRPRDVRGPDKQRVRFPLNTSSEDLADLCGPGVYRIYALDALGEQLVDEHVARWDLSSGRDLRNGSLDPSTMQRMTSLGAPALVQPGASDLRFALETMAQMMRTNSDALRVVAESHVDLAKAIATVKGLPRNAHLPPPVYMPAIAANDEAKETDDEDDTEFDDSSAAPTNIYDVLKPFAEKAAELAPMFIGGMSPPGKSVSATKPAGSSAESSTETASPRFEARELIDMNYAHKKGEAKRAATAANDAEAAIRRQIMSDPELLQQLLAIKRALGPNEVDVLLGAVRAWPEDSQQQFLAQLKSNTTELAIEFCREVIKDIHAQQPQEEGEA